MCFDHYYRCFNLKSTIKTVKLFAGEVDENSKVPRHWCKRCRNLGVLTINTFIVLTCNRNGDIKLRLCAREDFRVLTSPRKIRRILPVKIVRLQSRFSKPALYHTRNTLYLTTVEGTQQLYDSIAMELCGFRSHTISYYSMYVSSHGLYVDANNNINISPSPPPRLSLQSTVHFYCRNIMCSW